METCRPPQNNLQNLISLHWKNISIIYSLIQLLIIINNKNMAVAVILQPRYQAHTWAIRCRHSSISNHQHLFMQCLYSSEVAGGSLAGPIKIAWAWAWRVPIHQLYLRVRMVFSGQSRICIITYDVNSSNHLQWYQCCTLRKKGHSLFLYLSASGLKIYLCITYVHTLYIHK